MSEKLPYEDAFSEGLNDLPVPDVAGSWEKMRAKLDEEDGKRRFLPPVAFRSCAGWGLLLLASLAALWFFVLQPGTSDEKAVPAGVESSAQNGSPTDREKQATPTAPANTETGSGLPAPAQDNPAASPETEESRITTGSSGTAAAQPGYPGGDPSGVSSTATTQQGATGTKRQPVEQKKKITALNPTNTPAFTGKESRAVRTTTASIRSRKETATRKKAVDVKDSTPQVPAIDAPGTAVVSTKAPAPSKRLDSAATTVYEKPVPVKAAVPARDTAIVKDSSAANTDSAVVKKTKRTPFWFSAGIGLQQIIPVAGQATVPYTYYGRSSSIYDYIPSVYLRLHYGEKWYLQGEFRYGAPQSIREFPFSRKTTYDSAQNDIVVTSVRLKKTYYHQLPLSFNYYIRPKWSIGVGGVYNYFYGAVTEEEVKNRDVATGSESIKTSIQNIRGFKDSFLYKTHVQFLFQTEYEWRRFTLGLRYTKDIQPYIKYTLPSGAIKDEKNQSLQVLLRFRLWQSRKSQK